MYCTGTVGGTVLGSTVRVPLSRTILYEDRLPASTAFLYSTVLYLYCTYCTTLPVLSIPTLTTVPTCYLPPTLPPTGYGIHASSTCLLRWLSDNNRIAVSPSHGKTQVLKQETYKDYP